MTKLTTTLLCEANKGLHDPDADFGFYESIQHSSLVRAYVGQVFDFCAVQLSQALYQKAELSVSVAEVARFLDSRGGRHTADMLGEAKTRQEMVQLLLQNLGAIKKYFVAWRKEVRAEEASLQGS